MSTRISIILRNLAVGLFLAIPACSTTDEGTPSNAAEIGKASVWMTSGDQSKLLSRQPDISLTRVGSTDHFTISIDPAKTFQVIDGFGAALTGSSAYLINQKMDAGQRHALLQELFDPSAGIGISFLRTTIGASDFSLSDFTYDDMPAGQTDYPLSNFSIARDQEDVLPVLKAVKAIFPDIKVMGSPWSPPAWMKTNGSLMGGNLKTLAYAAYANYFARFVQAYQAEGIKVYAITPQNEPLYSAATYPCMQMTVSEQIDFIKNNLGPTFAQSSIKTKILIYDHNWDQPEYPSAVMSDPGAQQYSAGTAFHGYGGDVSAMSTVHDAFPAKELHFTEMSGGEWAPDFSDNLLSDIDNVLIGTTRNWSRSVLFWNLALDEHHGPQNNGCANCRGVVTVNSVTGNVTRNVEYYSIGHFSKFIRPGAFRIYSSPPGTNLDYVAFLNPDGSRVLVISNSHTDPLNFTLVDGALAQFSKTIQGKSVLTITWKL